VHPGVGVGQVFGAHEKVVDDERRGEAVADARAQEGVAAGFGLARGGVGLVGDGDEIGPGVPGPVAPIEREAGLQGRDAG
jgi:hypothetical protein